MVKPEAVVMEDASTVWLQFLEVCDKCTHQQSFSLLIIVDGFFFLSDEPFLCSISLDVGLLKEHQLVVVINATGPWSQ